MNKVSINGIAINVNKSHDAVCVELELSLNFVRHINRYQESKCDEVLIDNYMFFLFFSVII